MSISAVDRKESVSESSAGAVERISVAVFADLEPDVDVDLKPVLKPVLRLGIASA